MLGKTMSALATETFPNSCSDMRRPEYAGKLKLKPKRGSDLASEVRVLASILWPIRPDVTKRILLVHVSQSIQQVALTYFMSRYAPNSPFNYLPRFYTDDTGPENIISAAIYAASLAIFSLKLKDQVVTNQAWSSYAHALKQTNSALSTPALRLQDDTLAAVLLLGLFEALFFSDQKSVENWTAHTLGSAELIRMRGIAQTHSEFGRRLLLHASHNLHASCTQRRVAVPNEYQRLFRDINKKLPDCPLRSLGLILDRLAYLHSLVSRVSSDGGLQAASEASQLDKEAILLHEQILRAGVLDPGTLDRGSSNPDSPCGDAARLRIVRLSNSIRIIRVSLNDLIQRCLAPELQEQRVTEEINDLRANSAAALSSLCEEILASYGHFVDSSNDRFIAASRCLMLPLSLIYQMPWLPQEFRREAFLALSKLGLDLDSTGTLEIAEALKASQDVHWQVIRLSTARVRRLLLT